MLRWAFSYNRCSLLLLVLVLPCLLIILSSCGGGASATPPPQQNNPVPSVSSISPAEATAGDAATIVTVNGSGFVSASVVKWNQTTRETTFVSATQLHVVLTAEDLSGAGTAQITVFNPAPGGGPSSGLAFSVKNPAPEVTSVTPGTVTVADAGGFVTVTGKGFVAKSSVTWNGTSRTTAFISKTQLNVTLLEADLTSAGSAQVAVTNPAPGGGTSATMALTIVYPNPVITSLSPSSVAAGSPDFILSIHGKGFVPASVAQLNGASRQTVFVNSTQLNMAVGGGDVTSISTAQITVVNPAPGGGASTASPLTISVYATPVISEIQPNAIVVNSPDTAVNLLGSGFTGVSTIQLNGTNVPVSYWGYQQIGFTLPAADLTSLTTFTITVSNPDTPASNPVTLSVIPNPPPTVASLYPSGAAVAGPGFTLSVQGSGFVPISVVRWNGSDRPTTFVNDSQLTAEIPAADVLSLGNNDVSVFNPAPGGGTSGNAGFTTYLSLPNKDLVYDATRKLFWVSLTSAAGPTLGNSIVSIDPYTGVLGTPIWVGSEPNKLAISGDGTTLWVSFNGTPSIRKVDLVTKTPTAVQPYFPGGWGGNVYASDLEVMPGSPSTVAVAASTVSIYDNANARPNTSSDGSTVLAFGANASTLYGFGSYYAGPLSIFSLNSSGIATTTHPANSGTYSSDLRYDNNRLYLTSGGVLNATTGNLLGTFAATGSVAPDSVLGRAFVANSNIFASNNQITAFDVNTYLPLASLSIGGVQNDFGGVTSLQRWGTDGLAFRTESQVFILRTALVRDLSGTPADLSVSLAAPSASSTGVNTSTTISVKNNGPNGASSVSLIATTNSDAIFVSATPSQGSCSGGPDVRCNLADLASGATATVAFVVVPTSPGTLTNTATVEGTSADPSDANNVASSTTTVTGSGYSPVPVLSAFTPQSSLAGAPSFTLTVNGSNFATTSIVKWNNTNLPTTFVSTTELSATVGASLVTSAGSVDIKVSTAAPGGGLSESLPFPIFQTVDLDTNDVVFDPFTRKLYASVPSTATQVSGNSIVPIDPLTGALGTPVFIGSEPTRMSVSDDGKYLYVVLAGANAIRRLDLTTLSPGTQFTTIGTLFNAGYVASDVAPMPGNHDAVAVVGYANGIQLYDVSSGGATQRTLTVGLVNNVYEGSVLAWGSPTNLYSNDEGLSPSSFHRFTVGPTSFAETDSTYFDAIGGKITFSRGLIFADGGGVLDASPVSPATPRLLGRFSTGGFSAADANINRVFFLSQNSYNVNSRIISSHDATRFTQVGSMELDGLPGDAFDLIRWGSDGLAFRTATDFWGSGSGKVVLLRGPFVLPRSLTSNPVPAISSASPASATAHAGNAWVTLTGSNFVVGSVVTWNGSARTTEFVSSSQLRVAIPAADLASVQTASIRVVNPTPGGGTSGILSFSVN